MEVRCLASNESLQKEARLAADSLTPRRSRAAGFLPYVNAIVDKEMNYWACPAPGAEVCRAPDLRGWRTPAANAGGRPVAAFLID
jgi:hypothetical protein